MMTGLGLNIMMLFWIIYGFIGSIVLMYWIVPNLIFYKLTGYESAEDEYERKQAKNRFKRIIRTCLFYLWVIIICVLFVSGLFNRNNTGQDMGSENARKESEQYISRTKEEVDKLNKEAKRNDKKEREERIIEEQQNNAESFNNFLENN